MSQTESIAPVTGGQDSQPSRSIFRRDIEGLRAVAFLAVVLFHAGLPGVGGGFIGVDVFFVISGFLITGMLFREVSSAGTVRLGRFYGARARRLLPASATVGIVTAIASAILLPTLQAKDVIVDGIASALYVSNYWFVMHGVDYQLAYSPPSPFQHYWSLGVEEQFYFLWPAVIIGTAWLLRRRPRRAGSPAASPTERPYVVVLALVGAASFAASLIATPWVPSVAFFSLPTRAWELAVGGLVALTATQWRRLPVWAAVITGWAGLAVVLLGCTALNVTTPYPGIAALLPVIGTALVIGAGCRAPSLGCGSLLAVRPMRAIGRVSYAWYLWHWPVLLLAPPLLGHPLGLAGRLATAAVSCAFAALTLRFIENPLRFAAPVRRSSLGSLVLGGVSTALAVCVGAGLLVSIPAPVGRGAPVSALTVTVAPLPGDDSLDRYDAEVQSAFGQVQAAVAASADLGAVPSNVNPSIAAAAAERPLAYFKGCMRNFLDADQPECVAGDTASKTRVALVGDSTAAMWIPGFWQLADQQHWRLETLTKGGCPMLDLPIINPFLRREFAECDRWRDLVLARLRSEHPSLIVLSLWRKYGARYDFPSGVTSYDPAWLGGLTRLVQQLGGTGAKVLVLGPAPDPHEEVPTCLSGHLDDATACAQPTLTAMNELGMAAEAAATKSGGGQYADLTELFCTTKRCPVIVGNTIVFHDANHLTFEYARLLAPVMGALADRALVTG
ncbi:MAG: acyltransferase [Mycobacterium sp.]|uniref:acyltransferase family protein n=1 Tax=Mycobacterium sp. TaxID=1785 RepID=UPI001EBD5AA8|nr:acyltransferase family protein [Mycobacterium sp.]MBV8786781.1 acyltransferase [Mycobacterium sp.]